MYYSNCMDALSPYTSCPDKYSRSRLFSRSKKTNFSTKFELQVIVQLSLTYYRHHRCAQLCVKYRLVNLTWHTWTSGLEEWHIRRKTTKQSFSNGPQTSVEWSTLSGLGKISRVQKSTPHLQRNMPFLQTSTRCLAMGWDGLGTRLEHAKIRCDCDFFVECGEIW